MRENQLLLSKGCRPRRSKKRKLGRFLRYCELERWTPKIKKVNDGVHAFMPIEGLVPSDVQIFIKCLFLEVTRRLKLLQRMLLWKKHLARVFGRVEILETRIVH